MTNRGGTIESLTPREREVLDLIARGKTNVEIASELGIRFDTAKWHVSEVLSKLGVERREEAARRWRESNRLHRRAVRAIGGTPTASWFAKATAAAAGTLVVVVGFIWVLAVVANDDGGSSRRILVAEANDSLRLFDAETHEELLNETLGDGPIAVPRFSPDGRYVAALGFEGDSGRMITVNVMDRTEYFSPPLEPSDAGEPVWSPDGTRIALGGRRLTVLTRTMEAVGQSDRAAPFGSGGMRVGRPVWSPDSRHVAVISNYALIVGTRDGERAIFEPDSLAQPPPDGMGLDAERDLVVAITWSDGRTLRVLVQRNGRPALDLSNPLGVEEAVAQVDGTTLQWETLQPLTGEEAEQTFATAPQPIPDELAQRALALVPGSAEAMVRGAEPWRTADGSAWVLVVPYAENNDVVGLPPTAKAVVFTEEPIVVDIGEDRGRSVRADRRRIDVVID